jgi:phage tail-like protein
MPDDGSKQSSTVWPLPKFHFQVSVDGVSASFSEVSGLAMEAQVIEYRGGNSKVFSTVKMPGLKKVPDVTLKKGVAATNSPVFAWFQSASLAGVVRKDVTISLLDEAGGVTMSWTLSKAWPVKTSADLNATGNEVAIETLVLAHEGLRIEGR